MGSDSWLFHGQEAKQAELQEATALPDRFERQEMGCRTGIYSGEESQGATPLGGHAQSD
jgi:hypothetical protein